MKLKKIASLALAGIMAVSMLAGCGEAASSSEPTTPPETVTGAAATINEELDKNARQISFTENNQVANWLTDYYSNNNVTFANANAAATDVATGKVADNTSVANGVKALLNAENYDFVASGNANVSVLGTVNNKEITNVAVYVLNAEKLTESNALKLVGQYIDDLDLPEEGTGTAVEKNYTYSGTVAAIEASTKGETSSVWVIAVTITQTPSDK